MTQLLLYEPRPVPDDVKELPGYLFKELLRLSELVRTLASGQLDATYVAPNPARDGMIRLADGTQWNPGSGQGFYGYYNGAWHLLG